jgi:thiamine biosynthesis lipoprotein
MPLTVGSALALVVALGSAAAAPTPSPIPSDKVVRQSRPLFGTVVEIMASVDTDEAARDTQPFAAAFDEIHRVEQLIDEDDPRSPVWRINQAAGGDAVVVDPETFYVLSELHRLSKLTKGAFDVTAAVYDAAWHFESSAAPTDDPGSDADVKASRPPVPQKSDIDRARALVGDQDLILDAAGRTARLKSKGERIGVKAVARGYALERAASILEERGLHDFVISAGGDLVVRGQKGDRPWMVGVQDPRAAGHFAALTVEPGAVMTTGDYEDFFFDGGVRYHNVLDPRTGQPATKCRSVTIVAKDALSAEALSRAVFVLGARDGVALVERLKDVEAIVVTSDNKVVVSKGLKTSLQMRPPTDGP